MVKKKHSSRAWRVRSAKQRIDLLYIQAQLGDGEADKELERVLDAVIGKRGRKFKGKLFANKAARRVFDAYEETLPVVQALKRRIVRFEAVAGGKMENIQEDLAATGADALEAQLGPWTPERFDRLSGQKPSDWLYEELAMVLGMSRDQVHRAVQRGRALAKQKTKISRLKSR